MSFSISFLGCYGIELGIVIEFELYLGIDSFVTIGIHYIDIHRSCGRIMIGNVDFCIS